MLTQRTIKLLSFYFSLIAKLKTCPFYFDNAKKRLKVIESPRDLLIWKLIIFIQLECSVFVIFRFIQCYATYETAGQVNFHLFWILGWSGPAGAALIIAYYRFEMVDNLNRVLQWDASLQRNKIVLINSNCRYIQYSINIKLILEYRTFETEETKLGCFGNWFGTFGPSPVFTFPDFYSHPAGFCRETAITFLFDNIYGNKLGYYWRSDILRVSGINLRLAINTLLVSHHISSYIPFNLVVFGISHVSTSITLCIAPVLDD